MERIGKVSAMPQKVNVDFCIDEQRKKPETFYCDSNVRRLKERLEAIKAGTATLEEHDLIED